MGQLHDVVLAALLHDIGKFSQRAFRGLEGAGDKAKRLEDFICPVREGRYTHRHAVYTADFILRHLTYLPEGFDRERVLRLAAYHHRPSDVEEKWIAEADALSSGMEREEEAEGPTEGFRTVVLRAVTNEIALEARAPETGEVWSVSLAPLDPEKAFPQREEGPRPDRTAEYQELWRKFLGDWARNQVADPWGFINRALTVLEKYTWCIPSATNVYPDISLFDHLKTTAAIAGCIASEGKVGESPFLLVAGDFGGIQHYLFGIQVGAGGLARRLRARSLSVSLAVESAVHWILRQLGLPLTNCLQSAGGRFVLLLPHNDDARRWVDEAAKNLGEWAARELGCELQPHIATLPIGPADLRDFGATLDELRTKLEQAKSVPLASVLIDGNGWTEERFLLSPLPVAEAGGLCSSCRRRAGQPRLVREREVSLCDRCFADAETGQRLVRGRFIAFLELETGPGQLPFGRYQIVEEETQIPQKAYLAMDLDGGCGTLPHTPVVGRYVARFVPRKEDGALVEFSELAKQSKGRKALAYLKADVDNLGLILTSGLRVTERDRRSISRITALSRTLELFFGGYVERLASKFGNVYTVYSGGDDLLLVGPWDAIIDFALRLREDFEQYTCRNPSWSMSAGIALVHENTPVLTAVEEADARLEGAKDTPGESTVPWPWPPQKNAESPRPSKNRLVALGTSLPWPQAKEAVSKGKRLLSWLEHEDEETKLSTAQVRRLFFYAGLYQRWQRSGDVMNFRYAPFLAYDIRRNWSKAPPEALDWVRPLAMPDSPDMPLLRFISEYALNGARQEGGEQ